MEQVEKKKIVKENIKKELVKVFWIFIIGSVIGYVLELIVGILQNGHYVSRQGLLIGPFIQVYGLGLVMYYLVMSRIKNMSNIKVFILSMILGGITEYLFSYFQEKLFGTISWDYSNRFLSLNGRTCLLYCVYWGIIALLFLKIIYPWLKNIEPLIYKRSVRIITVFLMIFMTFDITISALAASRQQERHDNIPPKNDFDIFLDKAYPDELLDRIYNNKREIE